jgi:UTP-glucose-1-phosphate uridylyltransferase
MVPSLLILAAGMGSRYGGLKQVDSFGPSGEAIIDYSIYDAMQAGFRKIVLVIRKNMEEDFKNFFEGRFSPELDIHYVYQELNHIPEGLEVPEGREKPWGTGHAVMVAGSKIQEPFVIINADDFYGAGSYRLAFDYLSSLNAADAKYCILGYQVSKTLSDHGHVSRAICETDNKQNLIGLVERTQIFRKNDKIVYKDDDDRLVPVSEQVNVSMNMMGFTPTIFQNLKNAFDTFIQKNITELKSEFFLPNVVGDLIIQNKAEVKVLPTDESWFGVTYKEDKPIVINKIKNLVESGKYPTPLW